MPQQKLKRFYKKPALLRVTGTKGLKQHWEVKRLSITNAKIGGGAYGDVYIGRLHFKDGSSNRVAVKVFKDQLSDVTAGLYQCAIEKLRAEGVPLPKMGMVKWNGKWHQVSQLFGSACKGSKLESLDSSTTAFTEILKNPDGRKEFAGLIAKTINAGYMPRLDFLNTFLHGSLFPIDIDGILPNAYASPILTPGLVRWVFSGYAGILVRLNPEHRKEIIDKIHASVRNPKFKRIIQNEGEYLSKLPK